MLAETLNIYAPHHPGSPPSRNQAGPAQENATGLGVWGGGRGGGGQEDRLFFASLCRIFAEKTDYFPQVYAAFSPRRLIIFCKSTPHFSPRRHIKRSLDLVYTQGILLYIHNRCIHILYSLDKKSTSYSLVIYYIA